MGEGQPQPVSEGVARAERGPAANRSPRRSAASTTALDTGAPKSHHSTSPPGGTGTRQHGTAVATAVARASRWIRSRRRCVGQDIIGDLKQVACSKLFEHRSGQVSTHRRRGELLHQRGFSTQPADPQTNAVATAAYIGARLGPGPRDGLMTGLVRRTGGSVRLVRTTIEIAVVITGWALGGTLGIATVLYALTIGPLVQLFLPHLTVRRAGSSLQTTGRRP